MAEVVKDAFQTGHNMPVEKEESSVNMHIETGSEVEYNPLSPHAILHEAWQPFRNVFGPTQSNQRQPFIVVLEPENATTSDRVAAFKKAEELYRRYRDLDYWAVDLQPRQNGTVEIRFAPVSGPKEKAKALFRNAWYDMNYGEW